MASLPSYSPPFSKCFFSPRTQEDIERDEQTYNSYQNLSSQLPVQHGWFPGCLYHYHSFWILKPFILSTMAIQSHFNPRPSDILLVTNPKSGSTWLKALSYSTLHRHSFSLSDHPLLTNTTSQCVPLLERLFSHRTIPDISVLPSPTIFSTHLPFSLLPKTTAVSCRIVYLCRDPKDTFVSLWNFVERLRISYHGENSEGMEFNKAFQSFSKGEAPHCPFWDHVLGYWNESLTRPEKVLFLKYEEMMDDPVNHLRKLAEFMGCPFSQDEERDGVVEGIVKFCSFDNLSNLEVNKTTDVSSEEKKNFTLPSACYFRKGKVGDWMNHMTMEMAEELDTIIEEKLQGSGLSFETSTAKASYMPS